MRLAAEIPHKVYKISIFAMNNRFSLQFEMDGLEQSYRYFIGDGIQGPQDVSKLVDNRFLEDVQITFDRMQKLRASTFKSTDDFEFDDII